jgi:hypothetical protein
MFSDNRTSPTVHKRVRDFYLDAEVHMRSEHVTEWHLLDRVASFTDHVKLSGVLIVERRLVEQESSTN